LLASALVIAAAVASLFGPEPVLRVVGSGWFLAGAGLSALADLVAAIVAITRRSWPRVIQHAGLALALAGVVVNQQAGANGYLFLEQAAGARNFYLSRDLRRLEELPVALSLDSIGSIARRGFRPAMVAWVTPEQGTAWPLTYNRPFARAGRQVLFSQVVAPGFLEEYGFTFGPDEYLLLHNQVAELSGGLRISSFGYDAAERKVGLLLGGNRQWLAAGDSVTVHGATLSLTEAAFAANAGAILIVNDVRFRFVIFAGFGLMLLGLVPPLFRRMT
jgi:hypothetical protein